MSARHALHERSINTFMNAICQDPAIKTNTGIKRRINKVDTPEYPPSPLRFRVTEDNTTKDRRGEASVPDVMQKEAAMTKEQTVDMEDEFDEGDSQETLKGSESSSSQQTAATETSQVRSVASMHAEKLKLRLQVAMYKIRTGQTHLPMSQLAIAPRSPQSPTPASQLPSRTSAVPTLLPAPLIEPTPFSARMTVPPQLPSSPQTSQNASPEAKGEVEPRAGGEVFRTPALPKHKKLDTTESPLSGLSSIQKRPRGRELNEDNELTSSAIRGSAARGLLGLMQGRGA